MKIGLTISRLGSGGAERQLIRLARGMRQRGHSVEVLCYGGPSAMDNELTGHGVAVRSGSGPGWAAKLRCFRAWLRDFQPGVVHGFMKRASTLAVLASLRCHDCALIGSDLSTATYNRRSPELWVALLAFAKADRVTTQTVLNQTSLETLAPWLKGKTVVIRNGLDMDQFKPAPPADETPFRFAVVGTVYRIKNPINVVHAVRLLKQRTQRDFRVDWYGRLGFDGDQRPSADYLRCRELLDQHALHDRFSFHGEQADIQAAYQNSNALLHASIQEGFPNAVVEGMACALPIVVSRVSDLPLIVKQAANGMVFDETDPEAIARAMQAMLELDGVSRRAMGLRSRQLALEWFGMERFLDEYEHLYKTIHASYEQASG